MATINILFYIVFILIGVGEANASDTAEDTCARWSSIAAQLTGSGRYQKCTRHAPPNCTRLDCTGEIRFSHLPLPTVMGAIDIKYCFGVQLNSCNDPISMDFYLLIPDKNVSYEVRIDEDKTIEIPGFRIPIPIGHVSAVLDFEFERKDDGNIKFSVTSKARIYTKVRSPINIDQLDRTLIDEETIHASPCQQKITNASSTPEKDFKNVACHEMKIPTKKARLTPLKPPASTTLFKTCGTGIDDIACSRGEICNTENNTCICKLEWQLIDHACVSASRWGSSCGSIDDCGFNEICQPPKQSETAVCTCEAGSGYDQPNQICKKGGKSVSVAPSSPSRQSDSSTSAPKANAGLNKEERNTSSSKLSMIIGASVGGVVFLVLLIVAIAYPLRRLRKRRHRDAGVVPILSHDDDNMIM